LCTIALLLSTGPRPSKQAAAGDNSALRKLGSRALEMYRQHRLSDSIQLSWQGYERARRDRDPLAATYFLNMLAGAQFASGAYERALESYLLTRDVAL